MLRFPVTFSAPLPVILTALEDPVHVRFPVTDIASAAVPPLVTAPLPFRLIPPALTIRVPVPIDIVPVPFSVSPFPAVTAPLPLAVIEPPPFTVIAPLVENVPPAPTVTAAPMTALTAWKLVPLTAKVPPVTFRACTAGVTPAALTVTVPPEFTVRFPAPTKPMSIVFPAPVIVTVPVPPQALDVVYVKFPLIDGVLVPIFNVPVPVADRFTIPVTVSAPKLMLPELTVASPLSVSVPAPVLVNVPPFTVRLVPLTVPVVCVIVPLVTVSE